MKLKLFPRRLSWCEFLDTIIEANYLAIIFLVPLWFAYIFPTYHMFELNKMVIFRILVWTLFFLTTCRLAINLPIRFDKSNQQIIKEWLKKYFLIPVILLTGLILILPFSLDAAKSFFGSYERQQGLASQLYYFFWAALMFFNLAFTTTSLLQKRLKNIALAAVLSGFVVAVYGILQILNIDFIAWPEPPHLTGRTMSTIGQPNFLASFLLLVIPLSAYLAYASKNFYRRSFFGAVVILQIICLFFTASRGGFLAFFLMLVVFGGFFLIASRLSKKIKIGIVTLLIILGVSGLGIMELVTPGRVKESFDLKRGSLAARVFFFQSAADAIIEKPVFGYGLENSDEVFIRYYERDWALYGQVSANADRAHNLILDILLVSGFFGLILFGIWYYSVLRLGWQESRRGNNQFLALALFLGLVGYVASLLFSFTIVAGEVYFWLFFAVLAVISARSNNQPIINLGASANYSLTSSYRVYGRTAVILLVLVISGWQIYRHATTLRADYYQNEINAAIGDLDFVYAAVLYQQTLNININSVQREKIDYFFGNALSNYCSYSPFRDAAEELILKRKISEIRFRLSDYSYVNLFLKAKLASCLNELEAADYYFSLVTEISPEWPLVHLARGHHFYLHGNMTEAEKYYQLADINLPDLTSPLINHEHRQAVINYKFLMYNSLGEGYFRQREYRRAEKFFQAAYRQRPEEYPLLKKIADSYYLRGDLDNALKYVRQGLQFSPGDYSWFVALAALNFEKGDVSEAITQIETAISLAPETEKSRLENLIADYQNKQ